MDQAQARFWSTDAAGLLQQLQVPPEGLSGEEASRRLTPSLLPAIISVNLAHGARRMAQLKVIVRRLASIENFGGMNDLCSDKTGTLTEGKLRLMSALDLDGKDSEKVFLLAYLIPPTRPDSPVPSTRRSATT
jgi:magnesium-transporting ATPase (P-type)